MDGRFLIGVGIGLLLACVLLRPYSRKELSMAEIEARARSMGMVYEEEIRALPGNGAEEKGVDNK